MTPVGWWGQPPERRARVALVTWGLAALLGLGLATGCESERQLGDCIGINETPGPRFRYEVSVRNVVLGAIFAEMIFPPIIVLVTEWSCPVGPAPAALPPTWERL